MPVLTPREVFDAYPSADLLDVVRPTLDQETLESYQGSWAEPTRDYLFLFLLNELVGAADDAPASLADLDQRLEAAIHDIRGLQSYLRYKQSEVQHQPDHEDDRPTTAALLASQG